MGKKKGKSGGAGAVGGTGGGDGDEKGKPGPSQPQNQPGGSKKKAEKPTPGSSGDSGPQKVEQQHVLRSKGPQQQQPGTKQQESAGGSKAAQQQEPQGAWGGKGTQQQQAQPDSRRSQGAWGGKGAIQQKHVEQRTPQQQSLQLRPQSPLQLRPQTPLQLRPQSPLQLRALSPLQQQPRPQSPLQQLQQRGPQQQQQQQQRGPQQQQQQQQRAPQQQQQQQQRAPQQQQQQQRAPQQQQQRAPQQQQQRAPQQQQQRAPQQQQFAPQQQQQRAPQQQQQQFAPQQQQQRAPQQQQQQFAPQHQQQQFAPQQQQQQQPFAPQRQQQQQQFAPQQQQQQQQFAPQQQQQQFAPQQQQQPAAPQQQQQQRSPQQQVQQTPVKQIKRSPSISSTASTSAMSLSQASNVSVSRGTRGRKMIVETNYLELILDNMKDLAFQYDIKFDPDKPKRFLRFAFMEYCLKVKIPIGGLAFDGKANCYSPRKLGPEYLKTCEIEVTDQESGQKKPYKVTLMETQSSAIELKSLKTYQKNRIDDRPLRALQCLDVILSAPCHLKGTRGGRSFYNPPSDGVKIDLTESYELWLGLFQAAVLGDRPFLNIDISHRAFASALPVVDIIRSLIDRGRLDEPLQRWMEDALQTYLNSLVVIYTPPRCFNSAPKRYKFLSVKMAANRQQFTIDNRRLTVAEYFQEKGYRLQFPNLPCIHIGSSIKTNYVPVELCQTAAGQLNFKKAGPRQVSAMIRYAATSTDVRKKKILKQFDYMAHNLNPTLKYFGVGVGQDFIKVDARVLNAPQLEYSRNKIEPRNGSWNCGSYIKPAELLAWAILILDERTHENDARNFGQMIVDGGKKLNMNISNKFTLTKSRDACLEESLNKFKRENQSIVFVIISGRNQNSYSKVKQNAEIRYGVLTQCIKPETILRRLSPATIQNILLKVNAKLNGLNHRIVPETSTAIMKDRNVMFIGADVTHPTPDQRSIPSVVGVVASHDLDGFQYNMQWRLQEPTKEIIEHMEAITLHHLNVYEKMNNKLPQVIIYYRDGVSEGQFQFINNIELRAMDSAFSKKKVGYRPKVTCLIVQKRHHTRFFPQGRDGIGKFNNVPPGTCVDKTITHPNECQFFLVSHESIQGTAKPTKYCVLRDDSQFNIDDLQAITYNMCHMFARCNRSVSYPAPAYYAHHGASRGKIYIDGRHLNMRELSAETNRLQVQNDIIGLHPMFFV